MSMMMVTDLDGTLLDGQSLLSEDNRQALDELREHGVVRVVTTGRSLYSARKVIDDEFPIDYLSVSSGALVLDWRTRSILDSHDMSVEQAAPAIRALFDRGIDFMIHQGTPDNHHFVYHRTGSPNPDFERRIDRYREFAGEWDREPPTGNICQLLGVEPASIPSHYRELVAELADLNVVLTTSPLDHQSRWIEIFPPHVSKASSARLIAKRHGIAHECIAAIGNDFNDRQLLEWAHRAFVVANAPTELREQYAVVASNDDNGFGEAARLLLAS
ncbi:MAG: HAD family hydrolase [Deltaproteobacteria bacterium]|nr:HAD family hydrolase [Deltaproteobacteria bacterium]